MTSVKLSFAMQYILNTKPSFLTVWAMSFWEKTIAKLSAVTLEKRRGNGDLANFFQAVGISTVTGRAWIQAAN